MAATAGVLDGGYVVVSQATNVLTCLTDCSFDGTRDQTETTCKNTTGAKSFKAGSTGWTISASGNHQEDAAANTGFWDLMTLWLGWYSQFGPVELYHFARPKARRGG